MKLHILGISGPYPESNGATSGYLLESGGTLLALDFGSGILSRLTALMPPESLDAILLSHWHFDHTADLTVLLYRLEAVGKQLRIIAPVDEGSAIRKIVSSAACFSLTDVRPGDTLAVGTCTIRVGEARHPVPAVGYRIESENRIFGYTGDTNTLPSLASFYRDSSLLLADALFPSEDWTEARPHLSARLAAELARNACAEKLVLTHLNPVYSPRLLLREAQAVHSCVSLARPGSILDV